ncbi:hypothetical protein ACM66B_001065 [Microbotryomycetes sp. NB124-2]
MVDLRYVQWLRDNDVRWHEAVELVEGRDESCAGVGVVARATLAADTVLVTIPKRAVLSAQSSALGRDALTALPSDASPTFVLATCLCFELLLGAQSHWQPYIHTFGRTPVAVATLWSRHSKAREWAQGTQLELELLQSNLDAEIVATFYEQHAGPLLKKQSALGQLTGHVSLSDFCRAFSFVSSRAFIVDSFHGLALVPFADAFNHSDMPHVNLESDIWVCPVCGSLSECVHDNAESGAARHEPAVAVSTAAMVDDCLMVVTRDIEADEEIFNTYGLWSNAKLVAHYGFLLDGNANDFVSLDPAFIFRQFWPDAGQDAASLSRVRSCARFVRQSLLEMSPELMTRSSIVDFDVSAASLHEQMTVDADARLSLPLWTTIVLAVRRVLPDTSESGSTGTDVELVQRMWSRAEEAYESGSDSKGPQCGDEQDVSAVSAAIVELCRRHAECQKCSRNSAASILDRAEGEPDEAIRLTMTALAHERALMESLANSWSAAGAEAGRIGAETRSNGIEMA